MLMIFFLESCLFPRCTCLYPVNFNSWHVFLFFKHCVFFVLKELLAEIVSAKHTFPPYFSFMIGLYKILLLVPVLMCPPKGRIYRVYGVWKRRKEKKYSV